MRLRVGGGSLIGSGALLLALLIFLPTLLNMVLHFIVQVAPYVAWAVGLFVLVVIVIAVIKWWLNR